MTRPHPEPAPATDVDLGGSTRLVALASLPERLLPASPHAPRALSDYREFQDGEVVPGTRYTVCRLIGSGGMGCVYEVEHVELGKRFVLKSLQRELSRRHDLVARLRNEWRALARLEHPNIVNVTDAGTSESGVPFYVMERLEGQTLGELLHYHRRLHPQQALAIAAGILDGLHAAHQIGVVHRDVKPPNVFLTANAVKILDFGIAKIKDAKDVITARGIAVGTPRYMSPEQAQGTTVDARSDIYATGLMLFEMVSGIGPFDDAKDHNELLLAQLGRKAPLLSSICVVAPELDAIVAGMLAKDPRERPASARDVADTLRSLSQRYAHFVGTQAPTLDAKPGTSAPPEPPTRVDGRRSGPPPVATRPDAPAAFERAQSASSQGDTTTLQPAIDVATTLAQLLPGAGGTQRLPYAVAERAPSFHGPDTLIEPPTQAPTAVPPSAPVRTEMLGAVPLLPDALPEVDAGPTRTFVPIVDAPNLTPPPVVPNALPVPARASARSRVGLSIAALFGLLIVGGGAWAALHARRLPAEKPPAAAAARPAPPVVEAPISAPARVEAPSVPVEAPLPSAVPAVVPPRVAQVTNRKAKQNSTSSLPSALPARKLAPLASAKAHPPNGDVGSGL